jgi:hypothetical protein
MIQLDPLYAPLVLFCSHDSTILSVNKDNHMLDQIYHGPKKGPPQRAQRRRSRAFLARRQRARPRGAAPPTPPRYPCVLGYLGG